MDFTEGTNEEKSIRAKKMMLWFGIASLVMSFAGLTSAFIASKSRVDWITDVPLPYAFTLSLVVIIFSSILLILSKRSLKNNIFGKAKIFFLLSIFSAIIFILLQFFGFYQLIESGYHFTGPTSNVASSFIFLIAFVHLLHAIVGLISLIVVYINLILSKYNSKKMLGFELALIFWNFVDILWIYLFLFLVFFR